MAQGRWCPMTGAAVACVLLFTAPAAFGEESVNRIRAVEVTEREGVTDVTILGTTPPRYRLDTLSRPPRLVVELLGARLEGLSPHMSSATDLVDGISLSEQTREGEQGARLVLHLRREVAHRVRVVEDGRLRIRLSGASSPPQVAQAPLSVNAQETVPAGEDDVLGRFRGICVDLVGLQAEAAPSPRVSSPDEIRRMRQEISTLRTTLVAARLEARTWRGRVEATDASGRAPASVLRESNNVRPAEPVTADLAPAEEDEEFFYPVRDGDTLTWIASVFRVSIADLLVWNPLVSPDRIRPGQGIRISGMRTRRHVVSRGEALSRIAERYGVTTESLATWNQGLESRDLRVGESLRVPAR